MHPPHSDACQTFGEHVTSIAFLDLPGLLQGPLSLHLVRLFLPLLSHPCLCGPRWFRHASNIRRRKKTKYGGIVYSFVGVDLDHRTVGRTRERLRTEPRPPVHFVCLFFARKALSRGLNHLMLHCFEVCMMCAVHCMGQNCAMPHNTLTGHTCVPASLFHGNDSDQRRRPTIAYLNQFTR